MDAAGQSWQPVGGANPKDRRLCLSLLLSLLVHALLLSLTFSGEEFGLPGFAFPWQDRKIDVPNLRVVLAPAPVTDPKSTVTTDSLPLPPVLTEQTVATGPTVVTFKSPGRRPVRPARATVSRNMPKANASPRPKKEATGTAKANARADLAPRSKSPPTVIALEESKEAEFVVPPAPFEPASAVSAASRDADGAAQARIDQPTRERVAEDATRGESEQQEATREEAARAESARLEAERQENARQAAARQELARQEVARVEAVRDQDARREAVRRAMGRQLDEEAARREAAQATTRLSPSSSALRRARLFGRTHPNAELILYAEAWSRKIHFNMTFDTVREAAKQPHNDPVVTVAIRSDGSVESVTFVRSSGVAAIDDAIRRIVQNQTPYLPFQPALARDFDVIEIRRTWHFDTSIRLY
jgi:TonB family protein